LPKKVRFDLYTFVAEYGIRKGEPFPLHCNCGGVVTIMPPFQEKFVICPSCESFIKIMVLGGDPGYVLGRNHDGEPILIPVQGSSKRALALTKEERGRLLRKMKEKNTP
jgi:hypothetical protein